VIHSAAREDLGGNIEELASRRTLLGKSPTIHRSLCAIDEANFVKIYLIVSTRFSAKDRVVFVSKQVFDCVQGVYLYTLYAIHNYICKNLKSGKCKHDITVITERELVIVVYFLNDLVVMRLLQIHCPAISITSVMIFLFDHDDPWLYD